MKGGNQKENRKKDKNGQSKGKRYTNWGNMKTKAFP
jgi:hypothetical protein